MIDIPLDVVKIYTGVGSRETPNDILDLMKRIALKFNTLDWICRTGDAKGADHAFRSWARKSEIYTAWDVDKVALTVAAFFHPSWDFLTYFQKNLQARNLYQITGKDVESLHEEGVLFSVEKLKLFYPKNKLSSLVICWTPDGAVTREATSRVTGGTGQVIRIASYLGIPICNLANRESRDKALNFVKGIK